MERPLVIMTPKSLLRLPAASSSIDALSNSGFQPLIDDAEISNREAVKRVVMCSGKVYYDLAEARRKTEDRRVAIVRLEQFYPFPLQAIREMLSRYANTNELIWAQEEPQNMGAWRALRHRLEEATPNVPLSYVGRPWRASPSEGYPTSHLREQDRIVREALA